MILFNHPIVGQLKVRLNPTSIEYTYNLVTNKEATYGGEIIQFLGINYGQLIISGRFGREGAHGRNRWGGGLLLEKDPDEFYVVDNGQKYGNGLSQMYEYFAEVFAVITQGGDDVVSGAWNQQPVTITLEKVGEPHKWTGFPVSFPSFKRSNEDFAPEWKIVFEVEEAPNELTSTLMQEEITRLRDNTGVVESRYSRPDDDANVFEDITEIIDKFRELLPAFTPEELDELIFFNASVPWRLMGASGGSTDDATPTDPEGPGAPGLAGTEVM